MSDATEHARRVVVLGTGTNVGKTWLSCRLLRRLREQGRGVIGLKPVESGVGESQPTDAALLAEAATADPAHAPYRFADPISPHLAARRAGARIELSQLLTYVQSHESCSASEVPTMTLIETAGGLLSPLASGLTNFELARALEPAKWLLVAPDALGVIHDLSATLEVCRTRGRVPDAVALCRARPSDASTGTNADEIVELGIAARSFLFAPDCEGELDRLLGRLLD